MFSGNAHVDFKVADRPLYNDSDLIKGYPFFAIPQFFAETRKEDEQGIGRNGKIF